MAAPYGISLEVKHWLTFIGELILCVVLIALCGVGIVAVWHMLSLILFLMSFLEIHWWLLPLGVVLDIIWVLWMNAVEKEWPIRAGWWGMLTAAVAMFATVDIVHEPIQSVPYLMGLFIGSYLGVSWKKRKRQNASTTNTP